MEKQNNAIFLDVILLRVGSREKKQYLINIQAMMILCRMCVILKTKFFSAVFCLKSR